jgi:hypothetical protein
MLARACRLGFEYKYTTHLRCELKLLRDNALLLHNPSVLSIRGNTIVHTTYIASMTRRFTVVQDIPALISH